MASDLKYAGRGVYITSTPRQDGATPRHLRTVKAPVGGTDVQRVLAAVRAWQAGTGSPEQVVALATRLTKSEQSARFLMAEAVRLYEKAGK